MIKVYVRACSETFKCVRPVLVSVQAQNRRLPATLRPLSKHLKGYVYLASRQGEYQKSINGGNSIDNRENKRLSDLTRSPNLGTIFSSACSQERQRTFSAHCLRCLCLIGPGLNPDFCPKQTAQLIVSSDKIPGVVIVAMLKLFVMQEAELGPQTKVEVYTQLDMKVEEE